MERVIFPSPTEIVDVILNYDLIDDDTKSTLIRGDNLISLHFTLGQWIRNTFGLWNPDNPYIKDTHPDDLSQEIIEKLAKRLKETHA